MTNTLCIVAGYLLGSIASAWVVTLLIGKVSIRSDADGRISPASVYYRLGMFPYILSVIMDILLAAGAVKLAITITHSEIIAMLSGVAAMIGHNWSIFLKFKGGQGATSMTGALAGLLLWQLGCGLAVAALVVAITRRTTFSTIVGVVTVVIATLLSRDFGPIVFYPIALLLLMMLKRIQLSRAKTSDCNRKSI
ncbi:MAG: glycerol-3-phosphate acyltransferase [Dehalococcoidia bacterium]|nr:glycerol-3-phosphate acyltransferase [Dehalococcoidia bacterium]